MTSGTTPDPTALDRADLRATVRARYGAVARRVADEGRRGAAGCDSAPGSAGCCGSTAATWDPITAALYDADQTAALPAGAVLASLGCGNPTALAELHEGETVLDLGSGGGIDVLLSARRVGPTGRAYGVDMTDAMLALARANQARAGATNVEFLKGEIEAIPLPSGSVDVVLSNCVINLSGDKRAALAEAFRVLRPGGRLAVSDVITRGDLPAPIRASMPLWTGCVAGALEEQEFLGLLRAVGFEQCSIEPTRVYTSDDAAALLAGTGLDVALAEQVAGKVLSAFVRARKPLAPTAEIRPATPGDLPDVERLLAASGLPRDGVRETFPSFVVARAADALAGVAGLESRGTDALLRSVAVDTAWRSRGLGRALVAHLLADAAARGMRSVYLLTTSAEHYFARLGFEVVPRDGVPAALQNTVEFEGACPATAVAMVRRLADPRERA